MEPKRIKLRTNNPPEVFKSIRFILSAPPFNQTTNIKLFGSFNYIRLLYKGYDYVEGDEVDKSILQALRNIVPTAKLELNHLAIFDYPFETILNLAQQGVRKSIQVYFFPEVEIDWMNFELSKYNHISKPVEFNMYFSTFETDERLRFVPDVMQVFLPATNFDQNLKSILTI